MTRFMACCFFATTLCLAGCSDDTDDPKLDTGVTADIAVTGDTGGGQDTGGTTDTGGATDTGGVTDTGSTADAGPMVCDKGKPTDADTAFAAVAGTYEGMASNFCTLVGGFYTENKKYQVIVSASPKRITFKTDKADLVATWDGMNDSACTLMTGSTILTIKYGSGKFGGLTFDSSNKVLVISNQVCILGSPTKL